MLKTVLKSAILLSFAATMAFGLQTLRFNVSEGDTDNAFNGILEVDLGDIGFTQKDIHPHVETFYRKVYEPKLTDEGVPNENYDPNFEMNLDNLGFITISSEQRMRELLLKAPQLGAFAPFNYFIYKKKNENKTYVGNVTAEAMLAITKTTDPEVVKKFTALIDELNRVTDAGMGGKVLYREVAKLPADTMMNFDLKIERGDDIAEAIIEFQEMFEELFEKNDFIIAGFRDFATYYAEEELDFERYDAYFVYSLCHFKFSYTLFNISQNPEAGAFAPCSMYIYLEKGTDTLKIGMPNVTNWISIANIKDPVMIKAIQDMDKKIINVMKELGAVEK